MTPNNDIDLDLIRCFMTVVENGGFTQASKILHVTQSGITLKIKRLEDQLECRLFTRTTKPLELSQDGEVVLSYARRLLDLNREMVQRVARPKKEGALRLGIVEHFGYHLLPAWLAEFRNRFPTVKVVTDMGMTHGLLKDLEDGKFDMVISSAGYTAMGEYKLAPSFQETHLQTETMLWVQAEGSTLDASKDPLPLVMFGPRCRFRPIALEALQRAGRTWEIVYDGGSLNAVQTGVQADLGFTVLSPLSITSGITVVDKNAGLPHLPTADISIYSRKNATNPRVQQLATFLVESVASWEEEYHRSQAACPLPKIARSSNQRGKRSALITSKS